VLHVAGRKLAQGRAQNVLACERRPRHAQRHDILQLIAKPIGAARLIERRARPQRQTKRLIEQPSVEQHIHGSVGRFHLKDAQGLIPVIGDGPQNRIEIGSPIALQQGEGVGFRRLFAENQHEFVCFARPQAELRLHRTAGIQSAADPIRQSAGPQERRGFRQRSVTPDEFRPVAVQVCCRPPMSMKATRAWNSSAPGIARGQRGGL
jgi:hypothetical protein